MDILTKQWWIGSTQVHMSIFIRQEVRETNKERSESDWPPEEGKKGC